MKKITQLLFLFSFTVIVAQTQTPFNNSIQYSSSSSIDFSNDVDNVNFTAYRGISNSDKIYFKINNHTKQTYINANDYKWYFEIDGYSETVDNIREPTFTIPSGKTGNLIVKLSVTNNTNWAEVKNNVFTVFDEDGFKVKYVDNSNIQWPNGGVSDIDSPFSHRIMSNDDFDFHRGIDIVGNEGENIYAVADGVVNWYKNQSDTSDSRIVSIKHTMDTPMYFHGQVIEHYFSMYYHVNEMYVAKNQTITKGDFIAKLGTTGSNNYPHNHFEIRVGTSYSQSSMTNVNNYSVSPNGNDNKRNEFFTDKFDATDPIDSRVNPLLFLNNDANDNLSLKYTIKEVGNTFHITVKTDYLEDHFNKITLGYTGETKQTLDFNTRSGLPFVSGNYGDKRYDISSVNNVIINPIKFKFRTLNEITSDKKYQITFILDNSNNKNINDVYVRARDMYGNKGVKVDLVELALNEIFIGTINTTVNGNKIGDIDKDNNAASEDRFLEFINISGRNLDIKDYKFYTGSGNGTLRYTENQSLEIAPNETFVLYNKGNNLPSYLSNTKMAKASQWLGFNNPTNVNVIVKTKENQEVLNFNNLGSIPNITSNKNQSYAKNSSGNFVPQEDINGLLFSPGYNNDIENPLILSEVSYRASSYKDDFIELKNNTVFPLNISGYEFYDETRYPSSTPRHTVPATTFIPESGVYLVFSGDNNLFDDTYNDDVVKATASDGSLALNEVDAVYIKNDNNVVIIEEVYNNSDFSGINNNHSIVINSSGNFEMHSDCSGLEDNSPGISSNICLGAKSSTKTKQLAENITKSVDNVIYPNPVHKTLFVSDHLYKNFIMYNYLGKKIKANTIKNNQINVGNLKNGIYLIRVFKEDGSHEVKKIIKK
ncbi:peptidoglycan DD-metalloendopeptidase family protein [Polaribacter porphyrae]|uniref:LTD domain-containing protein n=1 Tax=Polaribacter porphyrae TaxID=1137780 RepID=A0A2S7WQ43_9FLAO|nr:peptidoglycan DD-metalloendopeptidase family protein [Polaribacter porphyrae]PQJ79719.1 hypothetical protein BTO18_11285 [Polaribacter porphyrae]